MDGGSWFGVRGGVGGCGWYWEGLLGWLTRWLWSATAGGGRLVCGEAGGISSLVAKSGEFSYRCRDWGVLCKIKGFVGFLVKNGDLREISGKW